MFERVRDKRVATVAVVLFGGGLVVGCGNTVEGVGNVPMVNCGSKDSPHSNSENIADVPKDEEIQMGEAIITDQNGDYPAAGDFSVDSNGNGNFRVNTRANGNGGGKNHVAYIIPSTSAGPNTVTVDDNGELYSITGSQGPQGSTALSIDVKCY